MGMVRIRYQPLINYKSMFKPTLYIQSSTLNFQKHPYHLVDPSPWPLVAAIGAFCSTTGGVITMHDFNGGSTLFFLGQAMIIYVMFA